MKKFLSVLALSGMAVLPSTVFASAASDAILNDLAATSGYVNIKYTNFDMGVLYDVGTGTYGGAGATSAAEVAAGETALDALGQAPATGANPTSEDSWGIARISSITDKIGNSDFYTAGKYNTEMTVMFHGLKDYYADINGSVQKIDSTGMVLEIYVADLGVPADNYDSTQGSAGRTGVGTYNTVTDGELVLRLVSVGGHINSGTNGGGAASEFQSTVNVDNLNGQGLAYLAVTGGSWASYFDSNVYNGTNLGDFNTAFGAINAALGYTAADGLVTFTDTPATNNDWLIHSDDPLRLRITLPVPEPITAASGLMALGALALSATRRRKA